MSKVSFRARQLDATKPMVIFHETDIPDLSEYASINRAVPQMPSGMEKEEEMELHLQQAISAQHASSTGEVHVAADQFHIPIPSVSAAINTEIFQCTRPKNYKPPKQYVKVQNTLNLEPEQPDYDMDGEDEAWLKQQSSRIEIEDRQFEKIMDRLEKQSEHRVVSLEEAKQALQEEDDDLVIAIYDYWLNKRLHTKVTSLIPRVRTERRDGLLLGYGTAPANSPYLAFRRRAEKMQTRKNRKNDEESFEKMLRIRHDLGRALTLLEMVKRREKTKKEYIHLNADIFSRRFDLQDWSDLIYNDLLRLCKPSYQFSREEMQMARGLPAGRPKTAATVGRKRKHQDSTGWPLDAWTTQGLPPLKIVASASDRAAPEDEFDGKFAFRRRLGCVYQKVNFNGAGGRFDGEEKLKQQQQKRGGVGVSGGNEIPTKIQTSEKKFVHAFLHYGSRLQYAGRVRRRIGRGGRVIFDRVQLPGDQEKKFTSDSFRNPYFRPVSPLHIDYPHCSTDLAFPTASDEVDGPRAVLLDSEGRPAVVNFAAGVGFTEFPDQQAAPIRMSALKAAQAIGGDSWTRSLNSGATATDMRHENFVHEISADEVYALKAAVWTRREYEQFAVKLKQERASSNSNSNFSSSFGAAAVAAATAQGTSSSSSGSGSAVQAPAPPPASSSNVNSKLANNNNWAETGNQATLSGSKEDRRLSSSSAFSVFSSSSSSSSAAAVVSSSSSASSFSSQNSSASAVATAGTSTKGLPPTAAVDSASPLVTTTSTTVSSLTYGIPTSLISPTSSTSSLMNGTGRTQINGGPEEANELNYPLPTPSPSPNSTTIRQNSFGETVQRRDPVNPVTISIHKRFQPVQPIPLILDEVEMLKNNNSTTAGIQHPNGNWINQSPPKREEIT